MIKLSPLFFLLLGLFFSFHAYSQGENVPQPATLPSTTGGGAAGTGSETQAQTQTAAGATEETSVAEKEISVVLGIDKIEKLTFTPNPKPQVGNETILTYEIIPQKQEITFKGLKAGKTSVTIRDTVGDIKARYVVSIESNNLAKQVAELKELLGDVEGLEIGIKGGLVYVGGEIIVPKEIGRISVVLERYPDVLRMVELSPQTQIVIAQKMQEEIQRNKMKEVTVRVVNKQYWLEGTVGSAGEQKIAEEIAKAYLPDEIKSIGDKSTDFKQIETNRLVSFISVNQQQEKAPSPKMLKIVAQFVELAKDYGKIFGFSWTPTLGADGGQIQVFKAGDGGVTSSSDGTLSGTISNLIPKLASAKNAGYAKEIQSAMVLTKSGEAAKVSKTTTIPFDVGTGEFTRGESATAGMDFDVTPTVLEEEQIELGIGIGIKIASGVTATGKPLTTDNSLKAKVVVKNKESAVIGGVVIKQNKVAYDKDPPGGQTGGVEGGQFLFSFIRSRSYITSNAQHVVFVTPEILASASTGTEEIKKKFTKKRGF